MEDEDGKRVAFRICPTHNTILVSPGDFSDELLCVAGGHKATTFKVVLGAKVFGPQWEMREPDEHRGEINRRSAERCRARKEAMA